MSEQTYALVELPNHETTAEDLAARFSTTADDLISRAFAVRGHFNHNVDEYGVGIFVYSTNDTGSSGKGGDILRAGDLHDIPSEPSVSFLLIRERKQLPKKDADMGPLGPVPEIEERNGRLGPLTGAYEFAEYRHSPLISSDHVASGHNWIEARTFGKPTLRPASDGSLETAAAATKAKLEAIQEAVEAAEARASQTAGRTKILPMLKNWFRQGPPFNQ